MKIILGIFCTWSMFYLAQSANPLEVLTQLIEHDEVEMPQSFSKRLHKSKIVSFGQTHCLVLSGQAKKDCLSKSQSKDQLMAKNTEDKSHVFDLLNKALKMAREFKKLQERSANYNERLTATKGSIIEKSQTSDEEEDEVEEVDYDPVDEKDDKLLAFHVVEGRSRPSG